MLYLVLYSIAHTTLSHSPPDINSFVKMFCSAVKLFCSRAQKAKESVWFLTKLGKLIFQQFQLCMLITSVSSLLFFNLLSYITPPTPLSNELTLPLFGYKRNEYLPAGLLGCYYCWVVTKYINAT